MPRIRKMPVLSMSTKATARKSPTKRNAKPVRKPTRPPAVMGVILSNDGKHRAKAKQLETSHEKKGLITINTGLMTIFITSLVMSCDGVRCTIKKSQAKSTR
jgi:hypothetical protein